MYVMHDQINTFDNSTKICHVLTEIMKARGSLLAFAYIADIPMYIFEKYVLCI